MNVRLTILLAVLAAMIASTWAIIEFTDLVSRGEPEQEEPWLFKIDETDIAHIEVVYQDEAIEFVRDPGSYQWEIIGIPTTRSSTNAGPAPRCSSAGQGLTGG